MWRYRRTAGWLLSPASRASRTWVEAEAVARVDVGGQVRRRHIGSSADEGIDGAVPRAWCDACRDDENEHVSQHG